MRRICIFVHWDKDNIIDDYVVSYLNGLREVVGDIIFVSNCELQKAEQQKISNIVSKIELRDNIGYDFMAWRDGIRLVGYDELPKYDELILCNDSCFAPINPFKDMFSRMSSKECDFWGVTDSHQVKYHIQSYFTVFRKKAFQSRQFKDFFENITVLPTKEQVIRDYEVGMSSMLRNAGMKITAAYKISDMIKDIPLREIIKDKKIRLRNMFKNKKLTGTGFCGGAKESKFLRLVKKILFSNSVFFLTPKHVNTSFVAWRQLLERGCPLIKVMLIRDNPIEIEDVNIYYTELENKSNFDVDSIKRHIKRLS